MFDSGKIDEAVELLVKPGGTTIYELKSILKSPERLEFYDFGGRP